MLYQKAIIIPLSIALILLGSLTLPHLGGDKSEESHRKSREKMVRYQIETRGISDPDVLKAMLKVERHKFVPALNRIL